MKWHKKNYKLRRAAGRYWLLDMDQKSFDFKPPVCLNESGAYLFELSQKGLDRDAIVKELSSEFGLSPKEAGNDVDEFFCQLEKY